MSKLVITLMPELYGIYRMDSGSAVNIPEDAEGAFFSVTRTADEVSVVCREEIMLHDSVQEKCFRLFKVEGPLDFSLTGILATLLNPLAAAGVAVFTISTYDTDYLMVKAEKLEVAVSVLQKVATINLY